MYLYVQVVVLMHISLNGMNNVKKGTNNFIYFLYRTDFLCFRNLQFNITKYEYKSFEAVLKFSQCFSMHALYTVYVQNETEHVGFVA